jgi:hypothetical protein
VSGEREAVIRGLEASLSPAQVDDAIQLLDDDKALAKLELMAAEIRAITREAKKEPIASDEGEAEASELLVRGVAAGKELDALRRRQVDPLNAKVKAINGLFRIVSNPLEELCGKGATLERLILAYRDAKRARLEREAIEARRRQEAAALAEAEALRKAEEAKSAAARRKALEEAERAAQEAAAAQLAEPREMPRGTRTASGSTTSRERWIVLGIHDVGLVPRVYLEDPIVKEAIKGVVQRAVNAGAREIPGVSIGTSTALTRRIG